ncbi:MAG: hypothetical protein KDA38_02395, partial [Planctomycetales bacterium]|nr:hypothetical protein [Planctomycetales bacterium]
MARTRLITLATFENAGQAYAAQGCLAARGIMAQVDGDVSHTALSYVGSALGGVKLLVLAEDADAARECLATADPDSTDDSGPWQCDKCQEEVDAGFDVCWSCGATREEAAIPLKHVPLRAEVLPSLPAVENEPDASDPNDHSKLHLPRDPKNPYAAPTQVGAVNRASIVEERGGDDETEALVLRAWRASIIGLVFWPGILHFYSMWLLLRAAFSKSEELSPTASRRFKLALAVNILAAAFLAVAINAFLRFGG